VDFDAPGLAAWAKSHFGVELDVDQLLREGPGNRAAVIDRIAEAAEQRIDEADLSGLAKFTEKDYGAIELSKWADNKFGIKLPAEQIVKDIQNGPEGVIDHLLKEAEQLYRKREIEYPVEFAMAMAMQEMRISPQGAMEKMIAWANHRFGMGWTIDTLRTTPPQKARQDLLAASEKWVQDGQLAREIETALAITDPEKLAAHFKERFRMTLPPEVLRLTGQEREDAIRARVESVLRAELLYLERTMLLETLDPSWKDHLYAMDQLRDTINYRAFSQQDPRIEYKREGSRLFHQMMESVRERVSDFVFKLRLAPQMMAPPMMAPRPAPAAAPLDGGLYIPPSAQRPADGQPAVAPSRPASDVGSIISGPGFDGAPAAPLAPPAAAAPSERAQRDLEAAQRAGTADAPARAAPIVRAEKRYGRNDPCPRGSGRKYKKCCNRPDGTCNGGGMNGSPPAA
jgi:preprotein translocase subunit SecA